MTAAAEIEHVRLSITTRIGSMRVEQHDVAPITELIKAIDEALRVLGLGQSVRPSPETALAKLNKAFNVAILKLHNMELHDLLAEGQSSLVEKGVLKEVLP
ncbi:hypothetical protein [Burkholderia latens]|uniref:hypothetical protein n=1 Tax=Burkholderia latens TaxID=488446 RepID=UPI001AE4DBDB|nr:hypothetical protein [Burkholderia latens]MBR7964589.1 hypothetical protein [Burkholderia vietnamiensis]QTO46923.1 hypothetical protein J8I85_25860 [Burkholderia latens]